MQESRNMNLSISQAAWHSSIGYIYTPTQLQINGSTSIYKVQTKSFVKSIKDCTVTVQY